MNGATNRWDTYPPTERWSEIASHCEERGWEATLERQNVFAFEDEAACTLFLAGVGNDPRFLRFGNKVACPWEVLAEMRPRAAIIIGG